MSMQQFYMEGSKQRTEPSDVNKPVGFNKYTEGGFKKTVYLSDVIEDIKNNNIFGYSGMPTPTDQRIKYNFFADDVDNGESDDTSVLDIDWVQSRFMTPLKDIHSPLVLHMLKSTTHFKFRDTTIGGNFSCNPPPQFNRYADIRADDYLYPFSSTAVKNKEGALAFTTPSGSTYEIENQLTFESVSPYNGMGRFYGESLDDGRQLIYLQFGVPKFNGILDYLTNSINYTDAVIANKGRVPHNYNWSNVLGKGLMFLAFPVLTPMIWLAKKALSTVIGEKPFNYYYMEPTMHIYWGCVNQIANQFATQMGIMVPLATPSDEDPTSKATEVVTGRPYQFSSEAIDGINRMFAPGTVIFGEMTNYIDVYALMMRHQNNINALLKKKSEDSMIKETKTLEDIQKYILGSMGEKREGFSFRTNQYLYLYSDALADTLDQKGGNNPYVQTEPDPKAKKEEKDKNKNNTEQQSKEKTQQETWSMSGILSIAKRAIDGYLSDWAKSFDSTARGAGAQAVFEVQYTGQSSDSFSNSYGEIETGGKIKSMQQAVRNAKFNFSGGQTGSSIIDTATQALVDIGNGLLDAATFGFSSVVRGFISGGYTDIPQAWQDSSTSIATVTYTMDLVAPYGHTWSRFQNIVVPLSMILAGALPLRVGSAGYTSPFLCSIFSKSVQKVRLGMITEVSISRGTTNLGYTLDKKINALTVSITVSDFSGKISAPINNSLFTGKFNPFFDQTTGFSDYIDIIAGRDYHDSEWMWNRVKKNFSNLAKSYVGIWASTTGGILNPSSIGESIWNGPVSIFFANWAPVGQ